MECYEMGMLAKNMMTKSQGDDFEKNRLLSYLKKQLPLQIVSIKPIRNNVYLIESSSFSFILKGFSSYHRLKLQEAFAISLRKEGFKNTYSFLNLTNNEVLYFEGTYYGCLQFIKPSLQPFSFVNEKDRREGLELLQNYHLTTSRMANRYHTLIGRFKLRDKWRERTAKFLENISVVRFFIQKEMIDEILKWADWSLNGLVKAQPSIDKNITVILHGDVAHHNFLRSERNQLFLIDYDLISIGHPAFDYLQYGNRILPFIDWSFDELAKLELMKRYLTDKFFLYSLAFPTDIFREWNRIVREHQYSNPKRVRPVLDLTVNHFMERQNFVSDLKSIVKALE